MKECKYKKYCGNCSYLDIDYEEQLINKTKTLQELLDQNNIKVKVPKVSGMYFPYKYRNKVHLALKKHKGKTIVGFFEEGSGRVVDIDDCLLHADWLNRLIHIVKDYVKKYRIEPYDPLTKVGTIRYVIARVLDNDIIITLVTTTQNFAGRQYLYAKLKENFNNVSLYCNVNKRTDKLVFDANNFKHISGDKYLAGKMLGVRFLSASNSFLQTNLEICKTMYSKAMDLLDLQSNDRVLDLYSGIGITSILFAKKCEQVISIEYNQEATDMAKLNKKENKVENITIMTGACAQLINNIDTSKYNKIFLDPARMGAEKETIEKILASEAERIVYMSCEPSTLVRDLKLLIKRYNITSFEAYDMFPHTSHVETLVCLEKI